MAAFALEIFHTVIGEAKRAINYQRWEIQANGGDAEQFLLEVQMNVRNRKKSLLVTERGYGMTLLAVQEEDDRVSVCGERCYSCCERPLV